MRLGNSSAAQGRIAHLETKVMGRVERSATGKRNGGYAWFRQRPPVRLPAPSLWLPLDREGRLGRHPVFPRSEPCFLLRGCPGQNC